MFSNSGPLSSTGSSGLVNPREFAAHLAAQQQVSGFKCPLISHCSPRPKNKYTTPVRSVVKCFLKGGKKSETSLENFSRKISFKKDLLKEVK